MVSLPPWDQIEILVQPASDVAKFVLALVRRCLDKLLEIARVPRLCCDPHLLPQFGQIALYQRLLVLHHQLPDLGTVVQVRLRLFQPLLLGLVGQPLHLLGLIPNQSPQLVCCANANTSLEDVLDLLPRFIDYLLRLGAELVAHVFKLVDTAAEFVLENWVVIQGVVDRVAG